jgi:hypothetical protein
MPDSSVVPARLHEAMRYAVLGGGKRIRAALVYAAGEACAPTGKTLASAQNIALDHAAAAVELIHAYSLVHDDLPCMDDDDLRRGRPTVHVQFDEATAMLAGDALQPLAFELLAQMPIAPALVVQAVEMLARCAGSLGMAGGQAIDCASTGLSLDQEQLQAMHAMKTGAMMCWMSWPTQQPWAKPRERMPRRTNRLMCRCWALMRRVNCCRSCVRRLITLSCLSDLPARVLLKLPTTSSGAVVNRRRPEHWTPCTRYSHTYD